MKKHPDIRELVGNPAVRHWTGPCGHVVCYFCKALGCICSIVDCIFGVTLEGGKPGGGIYRGPRTAPRSIKDIKKSPRWRPGKHPWFTFPWQRRQRQKTNAEQEQSSLKTLAATNDKRPRAGHRAQQNGPT